MIAPITVSKMSVLYISLTTALFDSCKRGGGGNFIEFRVRAQFGRAVILE